MGREVPLQEDHDNRKGSAGRADTGCHAITDATFKDASRGNDGGATRRPPRLHCAWCGWTLRRPQRLRGSHGRHRVLARVSTCFYTDWAAAGELVAAGPQFRVPSGYMTLSLAIGQLRCWL